MGYHVTILRTDGSKRVPIQKEEFLTAVRKYPEIRVNAAAGTAQLYAGADLRATLTWNDGEIVTKVPEADVIDMMLRIATDLNARVRGDSFETYRSATDTYIHPDDSSNVQTAEAARTALVSKHKRRRFFWNIVRMVLLAVVVVLLLWRLTRN